MEIENMFFVAPHQWTGGWQTPSYISHCKSLFELSQIIFQNTSMAHQTKKQPNIASVCNRLSWLRRKEWNKWDGIRPNQKFHICILLYPFLSVFPECNLSVLPLLLLCMTLSLPHVFGRSGILEMLRERERENVSPPFSLYTLSAYCCGWFAIFGMQR